jgi:hypothetical protein
MKKAGNIITLILVSACASCYFDNEEALYPQPASCDTLQVSYVSDVEPILKTYCYACHGSSNYRSSGGNFLLEGYSNAKIVADNGLLLKSVRHDNGVSPMPKNSPKLSLCSIEKIYRWVAGGALNNE